MYEESQSSPASLRTEWMCPTSPPRVVSDSTSPDQSIRQEYNAHRRQVPESPSIYVGVTLHRPPNSPSCMSLFLFDQMYLVVGNIQQDLMQSFTTWAWATTFPPKIGLDFRSSFGPLYSTSLLQLVPGDVIVSINGRAVASLDVDNYLSKATRLDIVAVRTETARREAHHVLMMAHEANREYMAAQAAFRSMRPGTIPSPCQRCLFVQPSRESVGTFHYDRPNATPIMTPQVIPDCGPPRDRDTNPSVERAFTPAKPSFQVESGPCGVKNPLFRTEEGNPLMYEEVSLLDSDDGDRASPFLAPIEATSFSAWLTKRKASWREMRSKRKAEMAGDSGHRDGSAKLPLKNCPGKETQIYKWLQVRKDQWRCDRAKRRRCSEFGTMNESQAINLNTTPPQHPLVYLGLKLQRESVKESWGLHVAQVDECFLSVGHVREDAKSRKQWGWATTCPISEALLSANGNDVRTFFEARPFHSSSPMYLQPGDMIVSIDGQPISLFESLTDITNYLKQATTLSIIALRYDDALQTARAAWDEGKDAVDINGRAYHVANVAFRCMIPPWHSIFNGLFPNSSRKAEHYGLYSSCFLNRAIQDSALPQSARSNPFAIVPAVASEPRNALFCDDKGNPLLFEDNLEFDPEDGSRARSFLSTISKQSFPSWLEQRKTTWRKRWDVHSIRSDSNDEWSDGDDSPPSISSDFWTRQGLGPTLQHWLAASTSKWKQSYSWNRKKRERLEKECEEVVHFPSASTSGTADQMRTWLRVRKHQWRFLRRKRQRRLGEEDRIASSPPMNQQGGQEVRLEASSPCGVCPEADIVSDSKCAAADVPSPPRSIAIPRPTSEEMFIIDALLEEQERRRKALQERPPIDINFLFEAKLGAPDDVVGHCLKFLHRSEHGKLLCVSSATSKALKDRDGMWRTLCPSHWILPRRPRKRWHELYITKIRQEEEMSRKHADDILNKAAATLFKGDHLLKIEKLVEQGAERFGFDINYVSGVVCERNSLLNLAVIHSRPKVVRWLVETKGADIETCDRGNFTPLLNAAWAGDRYLVRFLLTHGCDRTKIGTGHFFDPLAPPEFKGLNAEGWARRKGHHDLAMLISLGL